MWVCSSGISTHSAFTGVFDLISCAEGNTACWHRSLGLEGPHQHIRVTGAGPQQDLSLLLSSFPGCLDFCSCIVTTMLSFAGVSALVTWDEAISVLPVHPHAPQSFLLCPYVDTFSVLLECVSVGPAPWFTLGGVC